LDQCHEAERKENYDPDHGDEEKEVDATDLLWR
jgi:hypothetical protein